MGVFQTKQFQGGHIVGEQYGNKTLSEYIGPDKYGSHRWMWKCELCQTIYGPSTFSHLKRHPQCQECARRHHTNPQWKGYREITGSYWCRLKFGAVNRNIEWDITIEYLWNLWEAQEGFCAYTGRKLQHGIDASVDRIDNSRGYVEGNLQWVHKTINRIKMHLPEDEFINLCQEICDYRGNGNEDRAL